MDPRQALPAIDRLLDRPEVRAWQARWGRRPVLTALRSALEKERRRWAPAPVGAEDPEGGDEAARDVSRPGELSGVLAAALAELEEGARPSLRRVLNATGVVLHTNLGRAPAARSALDALEVAAGYSNLEYDLDTGERGSRYDLCLSLLQELTGAPAALVVNNNAAAVALSVNELAQGRDVLVSRGELVEIGGSFRIPDIIRRAGGRLMEVGTTNRTRLADYRRALGPRSALILKVHPSNYRLVGFTGSVRLEELVKLGREAGIPVVHDLGSGLLFPELLPGFPEEPAVRFSLNAGADLVTWSGDKLLGGPQAGVLVGSHAAVERLRTNPLLRAFRVDKLTLAALEATLLLYRDPERAARHVPALRMLRETAEEVEARAIRTLAAHSPPPPVQVRIERMDSLVGGGAFPGFHLASGGWAVEGLPAGALEAACRAGEPPLVGRVADDRLWLDFRTLLPGEEPEAAGVLERAVRHVAAREEG